MPANESSEAGCSRRGAGNFSNSTSTQMERSITASLVSMTVGIISNTMALCILVKAYHRFRYRSKASFLLFCSGLVVTDFLGHLINGSLVLYVYASNMRWEAFDPRHIICGLFGVSMVFFGLSPLLLGSVMAVERCIGVTRPLFHSTALAAYHTKRLLGLTWLLAALVALLPILLWRPYQVQRSRSWCFFRLEGPRDWLEKLLPLIFSSLGLLALLVSIVCNMLTCCTLLQSKLRCRRHHLAKSTSHHLEMICQLMAILMVSCICWGPLLVIVIILSTQSQGECVASRLMMAIRMATWNQILDPWVYILLRKAVLRKVFQLRHCCWGSETQSHHLHHWKSSTLKSSVETSVTSIRTQISLPHASSCIWVSDSNMNQEKLAKLQAQVRIGGKGSARRKKKVVHRTATADDKKLQSSLKKLAVNNIAGIEEVNMIKDDGSVIHFNNPKVQASLSANTFAITGHAETKQLTEMLPGILSQLGADSLTSLRKLAEQFPRQVLDNKAPKPEDIEEEDDDVPDLVENFDEASKNEAT
ncbi:hypothetical protein DPEC_G00273630 [Dallia pectoralis]|uniref:Uncharacterized protein n=1 Tax=Dallia pectoralis TaxID=75939 RepID=A0ACC2FQF4_DALPE|nr:hypothetical protein DPEC_G00273630 [Dallia pectoralis]